MVVTTLCIGARSSVVTFTRFTNLRKLRLSFPVYVVNRKFEKLVRKFYLGLNHGAKKNRNTGVLQPTPLKKNLVPRFEAGTRKGKRDHIS